MILLFVKLFMQAWQCVRITWYELGNLDRTRANAAARRSIGLAVTALLATNIYLGGMYVAGLLLG